MTPPGETAFFEEKSEAVAESVENVEPGESEELLEDAEMFAIPDLFLEKETLPEGMSLVEEEGTDEIWPEER